MVIGCTNGIQWTFTKQLDDLDFADDICLPSHTHKHMQKKSSKLTQEAEKTGLEINIQEEQMEMSKTGLERPGIQHFKDSVKHIIFLNTKQDQNLQREKCAAIWL